MHWNKKKEDRTPEDYQKKANEQIQELKNQWKTFFRTGPIVIAAAIVMIALSIAWFVSNTKVDATGVQISAAGSEFDLAAAKADTVAPAVRSAGAYASLLTVPEGSEVTKQDKKLLSTGGSNTSISWAITNDSNMQNKTDQGIEPGSSGSMTFYIISHKDGPLSVKLNLTLTGYQVEGWDPSAATKKGADDTSTVTVKSLKEADSTAQQLLEGHVLLFAGCDKPDSNSTVSYSLYKAWISEDAEPWTMTLTNTCLKDSTAGNDTENAGGNAVKTASNSVPFLTRNEDGSLTWQIDQAIKEAAYPVTIYWIWPEVLESYIRTPQGYTKKYPLLFPTDSADSAKSTVQTASGSADTSLSALPKALFTKMCSVNGTADSGSGSNRYFLWTDQTTFQSTVTVDRLSLMRSNFNPAVYGTIASYYNMADQYLGRNVQYAKLTVDAQ